MSERNKILFVDRPSALEEIRKLASPLNDEWDTRFAPSGPEGMKHLEREPFTAVVSDIHMTVKDNVELLNEVRERFPDVVRIVLSDSSDRETVLRSTAKTAHQYLTKPCDTVVLRSALEGACGLRNWLRNESIKKVVSRMDSIPSIPSLYNEIMFELSRKDVSVPKIANIISKDVGMSAKVLQVVNSAFFCLRQRITNIAQAVNLLGYDLVRSLVFSLQVFSQFVLSRGSGLNLGQVWMHSFRVGLFSKAITEAETDDRSLIDDAFMAGMLHDMGKLILATNFPDEWNTARRLCDEENISLIEAENRVLSATHYEAGGYFTCLWGLPDAIVRAVSFHHLRCSLLGDRINSLMSVYAANTIEHEIESSKNGDDLHGEESDELPPFVDLSSENVSAAVEPGHLAAAQSASGFDGFEDFWVGRRIDAWKAICLKIAEREYNVM
jgi:HD-like signal output (HDOD) protein